MTFFFTICIWLCCGVQLLIAAYPNDWDYGVLRPHIERLSAEGYITTPISTWPISLDDLSAQLLDYTPVVPDSLKSSLDAVRHALIKQRQATRLGVSFLAYSIDTERSFSGEDYNKGDRVSVFMAQSFWEMKMVVSGTLGHTQSETFFSSFDGSGFHMPMGNWIVGYDQLSRRWGPSTQSGLILSQNSRPFPAFTIQRRRSLPFSYPLLDQLGPWTMVVLFGQLEENRLVPNAKVFAMRVTARPLESLELGVSRTAFWGGDGRSNDAATFWNMLIGNDNYHSDDVDKSRGLSEATEPGSQLAGFDFQWTFDLNKWPSRFYLECIGEDEDTLLGLIPRPFKWMNVWGLTIDLSSKLRVYVEQADTRLTRLGGVHQYNIEAYGMSRYGAYSYLDRIIGHTLGGDSFLNAIRLELTHSQQLYTMVLRDMYMGLSRGALLENDSQNRILADKRISEWVVAVHHIESNYRLGASVGLQILKTFNDSTLSTQYAPIFALYSSYSF